MRHRNFLTRTDSYKPTHFLQYPPGTTEVYSYFESRGGRFAETVFSGLQYYLQEYLAGPVFDQEDIELADELLKLHYGQDLFNRAGFQYIFDTYQGRLPLEIKAVPEGTVVPTSNVLMTVRNTDPKCYWLTNWIETMLVKTWYPTTVATQSREIKKVILDYLEKTGDPSLVGFKLHDFGYRGVSSEESAEIGGMAHLVNFLGTDTLGALELIAEHYGERMAGFSIPASEHSTITSWGKENEAQAYANMLNHYPDGLVACVSDSYNIYDACEKIWGGLLHDRVAQRKGTLVIRPDSGDPLVVLPKVFEILGEKFGYTTNSKGYKVLTPCVRVIQGDGVNYHSINAILRDLTDRGWSADNLAFGMGGALLQQLDRDTQKFAFKCSSVTVDGAQRDVWKDPTTDPGKWSKRGKLALVLDSNDVYHTMRTSEGVDNPDDVLETVFFNGEVKKSYTFKKIRERAEVRTAIGATV
jgi:nicotinamide phosphoribosyltransferase